MSISLAHCITQKNHFFSSAHPLGSRSPVLVHMHIHSTELPFHCITQESHLEFLINSSAQRRLIHHLHFCSHDNAPNTLGFHTFTLCSATDTSNSVDLLSHCVTQENHLEFCSTLCKEEVISTFQLSQIGTTHPSQGLSLRFVIWRMSHVAAIINSWLQAKSRE
jgi:hypothetical protein